MKPVFEPGARVRFSNQMLHDNCPAYYPPVGTVGKYDKLCLGVSGGFVQWPKGSTSGDDYWFCSHGSLELLEGGSV